MKCVILAAGRGRRLQRSDSKPLVSLLGLPLIERTMRTALEGGATEFVVITGYRSDQVAPFVSRLGQRLGITVTLVQKPDWERKENGYSLLQARDQLQEPFLLTMADHLFEADSVRRLLAAQLPDKGLLLACDRRLGNPLVDPDDVTRVQVDPTNGEIRDIGKGLTRFNALDTGLFLCAPEFLETLEEAVAGDDSSLSAGVRRLAGCGAGSLLRCLLPQRPGPARLAARRDHRRAHRLSGGDRRPGAQLYGRQI